MWYNKLKSKLGRDKEVADLVAGAKVLPIYSGEDATLYLRVDGKETYKEEEVSRDEYPGQHKLQTLSLSGTNATKAQSEISYWDANKNPWDETALQIVTSWFNIIIVCGDSNDVDYVGAFEGCINFSEINRRAGEPILEGNTTKKFFKDCIVFNSSLQTWDFSNIITSDNMFDGCLGLSNDNFHNTLLKMNMDKNDAITPDTPQNIGADGVVVTKQATMDLIEKMRLEGQIVNGYVDDVPIPVSITFNSEEIFNTTIYSFDGEKVVV